MEIREGQDLPQGNSGDSSTSVPEEMTPVRALRLIAGSACSNFTTGPGSCWRHDSRTPDAEYSAYRWCDACIALAALGRLTE
jgi:hypothetical protein